MKISDKIVEHRKLNGLTQEELAGKSNISLRTLQRIENDENTPRGKTLQLICEAMEIRLEDLHNDDLDQKPSITYTLFNYFFLVCLNLILMAIFGYLTFDAEANHISRFGGLLLSFFIPSFIVYYTPELNGIQRLMRYGTGFFIHFILVLIMHGFAVGFVTALFPCLLVASATLFYGRFLLRQD